MRRILLSVITSKLLLSSSAVYGQQIPLVDNYLPENLTSPTSLKFENATTANHIFSGLASLLDQLPNALKKNGHTIVPAIIKPYTPLYHAFSAARGPPPSPEWLAFEPEMSISIMGGQTPDLALYTYASNRELRVLYFDGSSAALTSTGDLDTQEVLLARRGGVVGGDGWLDDYARLESLCKWARGKGVEGFLRMNIGFELMWCDFSTGLDFVSHSNVTLPRSIPRPWFGPSPSGVPSNPPSVSAPDDLERLALLRNRYATRVPTGPKISPMLMHLVWEWIRIGQRGFKHPRYSVQLITSGLVTFYDTKFQSLMHFREGLPSEAHRVWNISNEDAILAVNQIEGLLSRTDLWTKQNVQWDEIARRIVENWSDRLAQLNQTLHDRQLNRTEKLETAQLVTYSLLNPFLDTTSLNDHESWLEPTIKRCMGSHTGFVSTSSLTSEERLLKDNTESVTLVLCRYAAGILDESLGREVTDVVVERWARDTKELMDWLNWSAWIKCTEDCGWNGMCVVPMWPLLDVDSPFPREIIRRPSCINHKDWVW